MVMLLRFRSGALLLAVAAFGAFGCASNFDAASKLQSLRVLAVQKDKPYARPGETVHLQMLVSDPRRADAGMRKLSVAWLSGCENPPGDSYQLCIQQFSPPFETPPCKSGSTCTSQGQLDYSLTLSPEIISSRPPPANPAQARYGSSFVFFAACAGKLVPFRSPDSPFGCVSDTGAQLSANDFVLGYTEVFAYDEFRNHNPIIGLDGATSFEVDGKTVEPDCIGDACVALAASELALQGPPSTSSGDAATPEGGLALEEGGVSGGAATDATPPGSDAPLPPHVPPPPSCQEGDPRCFPACTAADDDDCQKVSINLVVDMSSAEADDAAQAIEGRTVLEQMWINYYADNAKIEHDVKLLNDATTGWSPEHAADLRVPRTTGPFHVWGIAHDNRGGTQWVRVTLATRTPW